jgi:hypothetical protein
MRRHEDLRLITGRGRYTRILALYSSCYNQMRTHLALRKDAPLRRAIRIRNHHYHTNSVRIASSLRADMIFGKDKFTMDARGAPQWILLAHPLNEFAQLTANSGPAWPAARFPSPIGPKPGSMPPQDRVRLNDAGQTEQAWPEPGHPHQ